MVNLADQTAVSNTAAGWWMKKVIYQNSSKEEGYETCLAGGASKTHGEALQQGGLQEGVVSDDEQLGVANSYKATKSLSGGQTYRVKLFDERDFKRELFYRRNSWVVAHIFEGAKGLS